MDTLAARLHFARVALRLAFGLVPVLAGLDKFFNLLADWPAYLSPAVAAALPMSPDAFMHVVGVIEIAVGVAVLSPWTVYASYVAAVWLLCIAVNLVLGGFFDVAVRDVVMAIGAYTLAQLTAAEQAANAPALRDRRGVQHAA
jgi:uncharacterized membrane protein YphA (DoxX/SURF4 family)